MWLICTTKDRYEKRHHDVISLLFSVNVFCLFGVHVILEREREKEKKNRTIAGSIPSSYSLSQ